MHQQWTYGEREDLLPYLDGEDDEIFEYAIENRNFAIILKNDTTYDVCDTEDEAIEKIAYIYRNYAVVQNDKDLCYIARDDTDKRYKTPADAQADGVFDYVYVPRDMFSSPSSAKSSLSDTVRTKCARKCTSITGRNTRICIDLILSLFGTQEICLNFELILPQKHKKSTPSGVLFGLDNYQARVAVLSSYVIILVLPSFLKGSSILTSTCLIAQPLNKTSLVA